MGIVHEDSSVVNLKFVATLRRRIWLDELPQRRSASTFDRDFDSGP